MPDQKYVAPTFVNSVAISGFLNGNVNLALATIHWFPVEGDDGKLAVSAKEEIAVDLRLDLYCAQQLHDALGRIIEANTAPKSGIN